MAVRAARADATMETPMRNKLETLEGVDSPDSVFLFDSAETAEKVWLLHGDSPEDDIDSIRRLYKDLGLDYGKMERLLSRIDEHFITYSTPTHPSVTTETTAVLSCLVTPKRDGLRDPDGPASIPEPSKSKPRDTVWEGLTEPICVPGDPGGLYESTAPRDYDVEDESALINEDYDDGVARFGYKCDYERANPYESFNRGWPLLALAPKFGFVNSSADYCKSGAELRSNRDFDGEPDPGICIGRQQVDSNDRLVPSGVVLYKVLTVFPHPRRPLSSLGPAVKRASGYLRHIHSKEDEDFDGSVLHPDLSGFKFCWECRHLPDIILALELEGHAELARDLAATDFAERGRPARLEAARKYTGNLEKFAWAFYQLFDRPVGPPKSFYDDISAPYIARASILGSQAWLLCLDDLRLNDVLIYRVNAATTIDVSAELPKPIKTARACRHGPRKLSHGRIHCRPPDHTGASQYAASALEAPLNGGISVRSFAALVHQVNVLGSLPATTPAAVTRRRDSYPDKPELGKTRRSTKMPGIHVPGA